MFNKHQLFAYEVKREKTLQIFQCTFTFGLQYNAETTAIMKFYIRAENKHMLYNDKTNREHNFLKQYLGKVNSAK